MKNVLPSLLLLSLFFISCSESKKQADLDTPQKPLTGSWTIKSISGLSEMKYDTKKTNDPFLSFQTAESGNASAGCNTISFQVKTNDDGQIALETILITQLACQEYAATEMAIMTALSRARHYEVQKERLKLFDKNNTLLLTAYQVHPID